MMSRSATAQVMMSAMLVLAGQPCVDLPFAPLMVRV
jgi:hypothetical protein